MSGFFFHCALILYGASAIIYSTYLFKDEPPQAKWAHRLVSIGFIAHLLSIIHSFVLIGQLPVATMRDSISFFCFAIVGAFIYFERAHKAPILGAFVTPPLLLAMLVVETLPKEIRPVSPILFSRWFWIHTPVAFVSYAAFAITGAASTMYLIQERFLRKKSFGPLFRRLPPLETMDAISYRCLAIGFTFLTIALLSGFAWSRQTTGYFWNWSDSKQVCSLITWGGYAALLYGRLTRGWRGRRAALFSIAGFILLLITFIGTKHSVAW